MSALTDLSEEERYLYCLLTDDTGIDIAEFEWTDFDRPDGLFRLHDYQWELNGQTGMYQATQGARATGKSLGIQMRTSAFPWCFPGNDMLLTAPELNHLRPLTAAVEDRLKSSWLTRQMLPQSGKSDGFTRQPHWEVKFINGAKIVSRLPNKDGRGVKGQHALRLELDEAQDYPLAGWMEIVECLNRFNERSQWRVHGVPRGVRDRFYEITMGANSEWIVHRPMAMMRPSWSKAERDEKIKIYGGSRSANDYRRNIYGEHGDSANALFVLARLVAATDMDEGSEFNSDVYTIIRAEYEALDGETSDAKSASLLQMLDLPTCHRRGWKQAPKGYSSYHMGMDVGVTNHPSEILVFGQRAGTDKEKLDLLLRVHMQRIPVDDQEAVCDFLFAWYGRNDTPWTFGIDKTGVGFPLWQRMYEKYGDERIKGYNFSSKYVVALEDRELEVGEKEDDLQIERNIVEYSSDLLREMVDTQAILLPFDSELLQEWQGQTYTVVKSTSNPYGNRNYSRGKFHTLDAGKMAAAAKRLAPLDQILNQHQESVPIYDRFVGA